MSANPHKKNRQPYGTLPNVRRELRPGRGRKAKGYDAFRGTWAPKIAPRTSETAVGLG